MTDENTQMPDGAHAGTVETSIHESSSQSYDFLRRELQRLASEKRNVKDQLRDIEFKERAVQARPPSSSSTLSAAQAANSSRTTAIRDESPDTSGQVRQKRPRPDEATTPADSEAPSEEHSMLPDAKRQKVLDQATTESGTPAAAASSAPAKVAVQKDRRMFQQMLGTLHGFKKQIENGRVASALAQRQAVEAQVTARNEESSARDAEVYRQKISADRAHLRERDNALHSEMIEKEQMLFSWVLSEYNKLVQPWMITPTHVGVPIAWRPSKRDELVEQWRKENQEHPLEITLASQPEASRLPDPLAASASSDDSSEDSDHAPDEQDAQEGEVL